MAETLDKSQSLSEQIYKILRKRIISLKYPPGSFITEASVANELEISRMPVRGAIRRLEEDGLLVADFRKKIKVKDITAKDVEEIYQLREILETAAFRSIFENDKTWEYSFRLEEIVVRIRAAQNEPYLWEYQDTKFHMELVSALNSQRIDKIYQRNQDELIRIGLFSEKPQTHVRDIINGLYAFVGFMREKNYDKAYAILYNEHITAGRDMALAKIKV